MVGWIIIAVVALAALLLWKGLRTMWAESTAQVDALPPKNERSTWSVPTTVGQRVMWCPILARKVVLADTRIAEGEIGSVVDFNRAHQPVIAFDSRPGEADVTDKWAAARVLPPELTRPKRNAPPPQRSKKRKKRR